MLAAASLFFFAWPVSGAIAVGKSVEWLCTFSPVVLLADVVTVSEWSRHGEVEFESATLVLRPANVLKGQVEGDITFKFMGHGPVGKAGTKYLLFLDHAESWQPGQWQVVDWVNLEQPCKRGVQGVPYTKDGRILDNARDILRLVVRRLKMKVPSHRSTERIDGMANSLWIPAPGTSEQALYAGSSTFLLVPPDPEFLGVFLKRYRSVSESSRDSARYSDLIRVGTFLCPLSYYQDEEVGRLLRTALEDPRASTILIDQNAEKGLEAQPVKVYPIRQCAFEVLKAGGHKVKEPERFTPYFYADVHSTGGGWGFRDPVTKKGVNWNEVGR
jgi:hypothetical protein